MWSRCQQPDIRSVHPPSFYCIGWRSQVRQLQQLYPPVSEQLRLGREMFQQASQQTITSSFPILQTWKQTNIDGFHSPDSGLQTMCTWWWVQLNVGLLTDIPLLPFRSPYTTQRVLVKELTQSFQSLSIAQDNCIMGIKSNLRKTTIVCFLSFLISRLYINT